MNHGLSHDLDISAKVSRHWRLLFRFRQDQTILVVYIIAGFYFALNYLRFGTPFMDWSKYVEFSEILPYQARCLMAVVYGIGERLLGTADLATKLGARIPGGIVDPSHAVIAFLITILSFFVCCTSAASLGKNLFGPNWPSRPFALKRLVAISCMAIMAFALFVLNPNLNYILPYDLPGVAFQFLLLAMIAARAPIFAVLAVFAIASLNRETTLFVCIFLLISTFSSLGSRSEARYFVTLSVGTVAIWLTVKTWLSFVFSSAVTEEGSRLLVNIGYLVKGYQLASVVPLIILVWILGRSCGLKGMDDPMRRLLQACSWTGLVGFAVLFNYALLIEMRAFGDLIPYFFVACTSRVLGPSGDAFSAECSAESIKSASS